MAQEQGGGAVKTQTRRLDITLHDGPDEHREHMVSVMSLTPGVDIRPVAMVEARYLPGKALAGEERTHILDAAQWQALAGQQMALHLALIQLIRALVETTGESPEPPTPAVDRDAAALSRVATLLREDHRGLRSALKSEFRLSYVLVRCGGTIKEQAERMIGNLIDFFEGDTTPLEEGVIDEVEDTPSTPATEDEHDPWASFEFVEELLRVAVDASPGGKMVCAGPDVDEVLETLATHLTATQRARIRAYLHDADLRARLKDPSLEIPSAAPASGGREGVRSPLERAHEAMQALGMCQPPSEAATHHLELAQYGLRRLIETLGKGGAS